MKKMFVKIKESVEEKLRKLCSGLSPEKRVPAIVVLAALFAIGNFYMIFRAIHDIGREDVRPEIIEIPPMEIPDIVPADTLPDKRVQEMEEFFNRFNQKENGETEAGNQEIPGFCRDVPPVPRGDVAHFRTVRRGKKERGKKCGIQHRASRSEGSGHRRGQDCRL